MKQLVLDLEYLGSDEQAAVVSIGVSFIDGPSRSWRIDINEAKSHGTTDPDTLGFWSGQSELAREELTGTLSTLQAVTELQAWVTEHGFDETSKIWGKGPAIDCTLLKNAMRRVGVVPFWGFWQERCVRTALDFAPEANSLPFAGVRHRAEDDANHEAYQVAYALRKFGML